MVLKDDDFEAREARRVQGVADRKRLERERKKWVTLMKVSGRKGVPRSYALKKEMDDGRGD